MTALMVLMDLVLLATCMKRRGITVTYSGKVWSDELNAYISVAEAYLAGVGKVRRTAAQQQVFDLLLMDVAGKEARKALKARRTSRPDWDYERLLDIIVGLQERMAKGMTLIRNADAMISKMWASNKFAGYIWKAWKTPVSERTDKQAACISHPNNQCLIQWFERRANLWAHWTSLQQESNKLAKEFGLWPSYYTLVTTSFCTYGVDRRANVRDEGLDYNEKPNGLTGQWETDNPGDLADAHVAEQVKLQAAYKATEHGKKWHFVRKDTDGFKRMMIAKAAQRRMAQRVIDANRADKEEELVAEVKKAELKAVTTFVEENYSFKSEAQELHYMELLVTSD